MTHQIITKLYDTSDDAILTVRDLVDSDVSRDDISMIAIDAEGRFAPSLAAISYNEDTDAAEGAKTGAKLGAVIGGSAAVLAGLGALVLPGLGAVVAGGWLLTTLVGAAAGAGVGAASGGIIAAVRAANVPAEHAHIYAECVRRGGTLVTARVDDAQASMVEAIMLRREPVDPVARGASYQLNGWKEFDASAPALAAEEMRRERLRYQRDRAV